MTGKHLRVSYDWQDKSNCRVELDEVSIEKAITNLNINIPGGTVGPPVVKIEVGVFVVESAIENVETKLVLRPGAADLLIAHGWTPPADARE